MELNEERRDGKRKISLENFFLCWSPRRDLAIPHGRATSHGVKAQDRATFSQKVPAAVGCSRGVCARREERRDGKRKISLENFLLCSSPRRDLAIPHGGVARGGYPRKLSFPPPRPLSKSKSTPPLRFRGKKLDVQYPGINLCVFDEI